MICRSMSFRGETVGLVGESGCGKTTVGRTLLRLEKPTAGQISFAGVDVTRAGGEALKRYRRKMQVIFQDPYSSLNPRMTIGDIIARADAGLQARAEPRRGAREGRGAACAGRDCLTTWPSAIRTSCRAASASASASRARWRCEPEFIVCDEPVSALDVSIQAQIINLLEELQAKLGLTYLFIAHDLAVVRHISDRVIVMYLGRVMEIADRDALYRRAAASVHAARCWKRCRCPIRRSKRGATHASRRRSAEPARSALGLRVSHRCPLAEARNVRCRGRSCAR